MGICIKLLNLTNEENNEIQESEYNKIYKILSKNIITNADQNKKNKESDKPTKNKPSSSKPVYNRQINKNISREYTKKSTNPRYGYGNFDYE